MTYFSHQYLFPLTDFFFWFLFVVLFFPDGTIKYLSYFFFNIYKKFAAWNSDFYAVLLCSVLVSHVGF